MLTIAASPEALGDGRPDWSITAAPARQSLPASRYAGVSASGIRARSASGDDDTAPPKILQESLPRDYFWLLKRFS